MCGAVAVEKANVMSTQLPKRKDGSPYDPLETYGDWLRYIVLSDGQVLDLTTINREGVDMHHNTRMLHYFWATAEIFKPNKRPQVVK